VLVDVVGAPVVDELDVEEVVGAVVELVVVVVEVVGTSGSHASGMRSPSTSVGSLPHKTGKTVPDSAPRVPVRLSGLESVTVVLPAGSSKL
jgi:hypothetical protein